MQGIRRSTRWSLGWRMAVALAAIALLLDGSLRGADDRWPAGPLSQYAFSAPADDVVAITRVEGQLADGRKLELPLRVGESGISRAEIEARRDDIVAEPDRLVAVVDGWTRRHADQPTLRQVWLVQDRTTLHRGRTVGTDRVVLATWVVPR